MLEASEEELKYQQEELKKVNLILEEKATLLEEKNSAIEEARKHVTAKAQQLEQSNKYKSAFLANMSHELRTPLNSILILAKLLSEDKKNHLNEKQREHAQVIHKSGSDLLMLINDILDLSKIEAGKLDLQFEHLPIDEIMDDINSLFIELANENKINFKIETSINSNELIITDRIRTEQILKNLLSNAFKFTPAYGEVKLKFDLDDKKETLIIQVSDTGIGIPTEKQSLIFDAFQQADGSTSRKFGGTGLGLAICKELTTMMGGKIELISEAGKGSCFKITLPQTNVDIIEKNNNESIAKVEEIEIEYPIQKDRSLILIVEDDIVFASVIAEYCRKNNLDFMIANNGAQAVELTKTYHPSTIILDLILPIINGWEFIDIIKSSDDLRNIPIHVISAADQSIQTENLNVESYYQKPVGKKELDILFENIKNQENQITNIAFIGNPNVIDSTIIQAFAESNHKIKITFLEDASQSIKNNQIDYVFVSSQYVINNDFLSKQIFENNELSDKPLVYFNDSIDECIREINTVLNKNELMHLVPVEEIDTENLILNEDILRGKSVLVVDDDVRNIYSLTSILEPEQMNIYTAFSGDEAINKLKYNKIDIVLMDIMMPGKNGFDTIKEIRGEIEFNELPIIAVTAKAMKGDKELCIDAGANDYLTKPINAELLIRKMKQQLNTIKNENV